MDDDPKKGLRDYNAVLGRYKAELLHRPGFRRNVPDSVVTMLVNTAGDYSVTNGPEMVAVYHFPYFRSILEVVDDLLDLLRSGHGFGTFGDDLAVWNEGRLIAAIHGRMDAENENDEHQVVYFDEDRNDPIGGRMCSPSPGFPSYAEWVSRGKGLLDYDPSRPTVPDDELIDYLNSKDDDDE